MGMLKQIFFMLMEQSSDDSATKECWHLFSQLEREIEGAAKESNKRAKRQRVNDAKRTAKKMICILVDKAVEMKSKSSAQKKKKGVGR